MTQRDEGRGTDQNPERTSQKRGQQTWPTQSNSSGKRLGAKCTDLTLPFPSHRPQRLPIGQAQQKAGGQEHVHAVHQVSPGGENRQREPESESG